MNAWCIWVTVIYTCQPGKDCFTMTATYERLGFPDDNQLICSEVMYNYHPLLTEYLILLSCVKIIVENVMFFYKFFA